MDTTKQVSPEELAAEQAALKVRSAEDVRAEIIEEFGFDEAADKDRIEKMVNRELEKDKKLSTAIGQKIKYRDGKKDDTKTETKVDTQSSPAVGTKDDQMSILDQRALIKADVHDDDIDEVIGFAKFNKISIAEALKRPILVNTLAEKAEYRTTAAATNTGTTRRGGTAPSDDELVSAANSGKLPEDDASIAKLMAAKAPKPKRR